MRDCNASATACFLATSAAVSYTHLDVYKRQEEGFDVRKLVPAPTNTPEDAGPYITFGLCYATDPETGEHDVTIHRLCLQSPDEISIYMVPGARHIGAFYEKAEKLSLIHI